MGKLHDYLELVRIPGVFTAQADIVAGFLIAGGGIQQIVQLVLLLISSSFLYSAGMALNDLFDYQVDLKERPKRPIPSGRLKREEALCAAVLLLVAGVFAASHVRGASFVISLLLAGLILLYNGGIKKHRWLGPVTMGGCRYVNLLLGLSVLPLSAGMFLLPVLTGILIFGVTVLSRVEAKGAQSTVPILVSAGCIGAVYALYGIFLKFDILSHKTGFILCTFWAMLSSGYLLRLLGEKSPASIQRAVKLLILSLVILDGIIVTGVRPLYWSVAVWALLVPSIMVSKKFYVT